MSRARDFADLAGAADAGGITGKNMVVNGSMVISQRGTSFTGVADNAYTLDRFQMVENFGAVVDVSQASDAPSEGGFTKSLKVDVTTSATPTGSTSLVVMHKIEGQDFIRAGFGTSGAQPLTLSFWVKSNVTGTYRVNFFNLNGTGNKIVGGTYTINTASTWEKKTIAIPADTAQATYLTNAEGFRIEFYLASGPDRTSGSLPTDWIAYDATRRAAGHAVNVASSTSNEWYITGVQLEVGSATPFEHRSFGDELARCQRYFEKNDYRLGSVSSHNQTNRGYRYNIRHLVEKRATPTCTITETAKNRCSTPTAPNVFTTSVVLRTTNNNTDGDDFTADGTYTIDAEL